MPEPLTYAHERFREAHHAVARMLAAGQTPSMVRRNTGISIHRLTLLMNDPSFNALIAHYAERVAEVWDENVDKYLDLGMGNMILAEAQIAERLNDAIEGEPVPLMTLDRISQGRADRFGYSKHAVIHHNHSFDEQLEHAISRTKTKEIEGQVVTQPVESTATETATLPAPQTQAPALSPAAEPKREVATAPPSFVLALRKRFAA